MFTIEFSHQDDLESWTWLGDAKCFETALKSVLEQRQDDKKIVGFKFDYRIVKNGQVYYTTILES